MVGSLADCTSRPVQISSTLCDSEGLEQLMHEWKASQSKHLVAPKRLATGSLGHDMAKRRRMWEPTLLLHAAMPRELCVPHAKGWLLSLTLRMLCPN